jgi:hypothetical protein
MPYGIDENSHLVAELVDLCESGATLSAAYLSSLPAPKEPPAWMLRRVVPSMARPAVKTMRPIGDLEAVQRALGLSAKEQPQPLVDTDPAVREMVEGWQRELG